jgi:hypothetical protein
MTGWGPSAPDQDASPNDQGAPEGRLSPPENDVRLDVGDDPRVKRRWHSRRTVRRRRVVGDWDYRFDLRGTSPRCYRNGDVRIARGAAPDASFRIPTSGQLSWSARASTTLRSAPQPLIVADSL